MKRNLALYCYPRRCGKWRRTVRHLLARWSIFNGRKIVTIATDECCDPPELVQEALPGCEYRVVQNIPGLQETAHYLAALDALQSTRDDEVTLYAHCKGSTHTDDRAASHLWCDAMAAACLDYPALLDCMFARGANIAGAFRSHGLWNFPGYHAWHFAGTWFWFRHSRVFTMDWRNIHHNFMGVEAWPGILPVEESACLFYDRANTAHLYDPAFWRTNIGPSLKWWRRSLLAAGASPLCPSPPNHPDVAEFLAA